MGMTFRLPLVVGLLVVALGARAVYSIVPYKEAQKMSFRGALVRKALNNGAVANQAIGNNVTTPSYDQVTFDQEVYDTDSLWNATDNCFVIPAGVSKVRFQGQIVFNHNVDGTRQILVQRKSANNTNPNAWEFFTGQPIQNTRAVLNTTTDPSFSSAVLPVSEGDKFALVAWQTSGVNVDISGGTGTFFAMEIVE